jgi:hypothetical protein
VRPQKEKSSSCPFCNHNKLQITIAKKMLESQIQEREQEEQRVIEARIREQNGPTTTAAENQEGEDDQNHQLQNHQQNQNQHLQANSSGESTSYGSSLQEDDMVKIMRARSESFASSENNEQHDETAVLQSLAMTPEERRRLEDQMRAQHSHPLALRIQAEAAERRLQNERAYYRTQGGVTTLQAVAAASTDPRVQRTAAEVLRSTTAGGGGSSRRSNRGARGTASSSSSSSNSRDWNQIVEAFERGGNGEVQSIDDLVVLEAAILLSMEEEARHARADGDEAVDDFDAAQHARDGFPLVRSFLAARGEDGVDNATNEQVQMMARSFSNSRRSRRQHQLLRGGGGGEHRSSTENSTLDAASLLMRGISEEEQMALAIAASLQDHTSSNGEEGDDTTSTIDHENTPAATATAVSNEGSIAAEVEITGTNCGDELELEGGERAVVGIMLDDIIMSQNEMHGNHNPAPVAIEVASDHDDDDEGVHHETGDESTPSSVPVSPGGFPVEEEEEEATSAVVETHQGNNDDASDTVSRESDEELHLTAGVSDAEGPAAAVLPEEVGGVA